MLSIVVAGIGWGVALVAELRVGRGRDAHPALLRVRPAFDLLFCTAVLVSTWSSVLGIYHTTRWWDLPMHFFTNGLSAAMLYVVLVRLQVLADAETLPHPVLSAAVMVTALGLSLGVLWEFFEWFGCTYLDPKILTAGYSDTLDDLVQGGLGSLAVGLCMRFPRGSAACASAMSWPTLAARKRQHESRRLSDVSCRRGPARRAPGPFDPGQTAAASATASSSSSVIGRSGPLRPLMNSVRIADAVAAMPAIR